MAKLLMIAIKISGTSSMGWFHLKNGNCTACYNSHGCMQTSELSHTYFLEVNVSEKSSLSADLGDKFCNLISSRKSVLC